MARAWLDCLIAAALFGVATPASKVLLHSVGAQTLAGLLYLGAAVVTLPFALRTPLKAVQRLNVLRLAGAVLFGGVVAPVLLLTGLKLAPASSTSLWLNLEGTATALLSFLFFREHLGARVWAAVLVMFGASAFLSIAEGAGGGVAALFVVMACFAWGVDNNLTAVNDGFTPAQMTCIKGLVAGAVNLGLGAVLEPMPASSSPVLLALVLGALSYGVSLVLYIGGAQRLGATRSQVLFSTAPFMGLLVSWMILDEPVLATQLLAGVMMAVGVWLVQRASHTHAHVHPALTHTHKHRHDDGHHTHAHPGLAPDVEHTHAHEHEALEHDHPHVPDLHHRH
ncbi:MAG: EamA family transporter [Myxococcota bacterium]